MANALAGAIVLSSGGKRFRLKGTFTYNLGAPERKVIMGHQGPEGYSEMPTPPSLEGAITDHGTFNVRQELFDFVDRPLILELKNGKTIIFEQAWFEGDGNTTTEEAEIKVKFGAMSAREVRQ
jgi:hypothetical protein